MKPDQKHTKPIGCLLCRSRGSCFKRLDAVPIEPGRQRFELGVVQRHQSVLDSGPDEGCILEPLAGHHQARLAPWSLGPVARPWLTQCKSFSRSGLCERNTNAVPVNGSLRSTDDTSAHSPSCPLRKSMGWVATMFLTRFDGKIGDLPPTRARPTQSAPPSPRLPV